MRDRLTKERRSWNMSRIRGKHTSPEIAVRRLLHRMGYRFRLHVRIAIPLEGARESRELTRKGKLQLSNELVTLNRRPQRAQRANRFSQSDRIRVHSRDSRASSALAPRWVCPDIVLPKYKTVIFVHGCFWHRHRGCKNCTTPTNRREWWLTKLEGNAARDAVHRKALRKLGWRVIVVWECQVEKYSGASVLLSRLKSAKVSV